MKNSISNKLTSIILFILILCSSLFASTLTPEISNILPDSETIEPIHLATDSATNIIADVYTDYLLASYYQQMNDADNNIIELKNAIELLPDDASLRLELAQALYQNKETIAALSTLDQVKQLDPNDANAYLLTGKIYVMQNKPALAIESYTKATTIDPTSWESYFQLAQLYQELNNTMKRLSLIMNPQN